MADQRKNAGVWATRFEENPSGRVVLSTVMHTGTGFTHNLLKQDRSIKPFVIHLNERNGVTDEHWIKLLTLNPVVVPLRAPWKILRTWLLVREEQLDSLLEQLERLVDMVDPLDPIYLPLDRPELREAGLQRLNDTLGTKLMTSWRSFGEIAGIQPDRATLEIITEKAVYQKIWHDFGAFFEKFGYRKYPYE